MQDDVSRVVQVSSGSEEIQIVTDEGTFCMQIRDRDSPIALAIQQELCPLHCRHC